MLHADHAVAQRLCGYREVRGALFRPAWHESTARPCSSRTASSSAISIILTANGTLSLSRRTFRSGDRRRDHRTSDPRSHAHDAGGAAGSSRRRSPPITTPNVGSITSVGQDSRRPRQSANLSTSTNGPAGRSEIGHFREYTAHELGSTVTSAGFEVQQLFTTFIEEFLDRTGRC